MVVIIAQLLNQKKIELKKNNGMKKVFVICLYLTQIYCQKKPANLSLLPIVKADTVFIKNIDWIPITNEVSYQKVENGRNGLKATKFLLSLIATFHYNNNSYSEIVDSGLVMTKKDLSKLTLSNFFNKENTFDCYLKVNSKVFYKVDPQILSQIYNLVDNEEEAANIISEIKGNHQISSYKIDSEVDEELITHKKTKKFTLILSLKKEYWNLDAISRITTELNQKISKITSNKFYFKEISSGNNEAEAIYLLRQLE